MVETLRKRFLNPFFIAAVLFAIPVYGGLVKVADRHPFKSLVLTESIVEVKGKIVSNPSQNSSGRFYSIVLSVDHVRASWTGCEMSSEANGNVTCLVPSDIVESLYPGKLFSSFGKKSIFEKGEKVCLYGRFNGVYFTVTDADYIESKKCWSNMIVHARSLCRLQFKRLMYSWNNAGGFILALLSGSREYTEKRLTDNFRRAGLSHILALSGMHLSFFAGLVGGTGKRLFGKKSSFFLKLLGILVFVWFAGLSPSLLRALLCSVIMLLCSSVFSMDVDYFLVLCSVFLIHCVISPSDIFSAAFILSYGALGGILLMGDFFYALLCRGIPNSISSSLSASLGAQCATAPVTIGMFGALMPCGIVASVVVSPMVSIFLSAALFSIVICLVLPFLAPVFGCIMNVLYKIIAMTVQVFAFVPPLVL